MTLAKPRRASRRRPHERIPGIAVTPGMGGKPSFVIRFLTEQLVDDLAFVNDPHRTAQRADVFGASVHIQ